VLGPGRVGQTVANRLRERGVEVVLGREPRLAADCEVAFVCVPDDRIAGVAALLPAGTFAVHCSGALSVTALNPHRGCALHPLTSFAPGGDPTQLDGVPAAVTGGDAEAAAVGDELARLLGLRPFPLADGAKPLYHCAAVIAGNYTATLLAASVAAARAAGIDEPRAREMLGGLASLALARAAAGGADYALTGPIARGDAATVASHLAELERAAPELVPLYRVLAAATVELLAPQRRDALAGVLA
jgi:predicted short-subunit dehydrogenase-like oxidoreductase (DUF2520 family)